MCVFFPQGELRISVLPTYLSYDAPWPVRKIPLRCTVHYVSYHVESKARLLSLSPHSTRGTEAARRDTNSSRNTFPGLTHLHLHNVMQNKSVSIGGCFEKLKMKAPLALKFSYCARGKKKSMRVTLKGLVFDVKFLRVTVDFSFSGVCCVHQCERALHSHPQDDWRGEGVWSHRARSDMNTRTHLLFTLVWHTHTALLDEFRPYPACSRCLP